MLAQDVVRVTRTPDADRMTRETVLGSACFNGLGRLRPSYAEHVKR